MKRAVGNGGFAGAISWGEMVGGVDYGFAVVSTDAGTHDAGPGADAKWAENNTEQVTDWGWRALHETVLMGKKLVTEHYGRAPSHSYYMGCSTGGRQGLKEAQLFPEEFDGIIAGAPAWWTKHLQLWNGKVAMYNLPIDASHHIPTEMFAVIEREVLKQCDPQDGVVDNIISDPSKCEFKLETLLCGAGTTKNCLTLPQINMLEKVYSDWTEANQTTIFSHLFYGSESSWPMAMGQKEPPTLMTGYVKYMLGLGPNWRWQDTNFPELIALSDRMNVGNATADNFDMSPYFKRGGKLLHYHGWADSSITPGSSIHFRKQVERTLKTKGFQDLDSSYRFFLVPGMGHCGGSSSLTNAPDFIGARGGMGMNKELSAKLRTPKHDILLAMMHWVENGTAPDSIIASKIDAKAGGIYQQRPLCVYPKQARYRGTGDVKDASSWECKALY
ncbi:tannase and feruloyl esterase [Microthyrium microscopicum]|uniref:Carboxylic ester hydrolase n=1 Tax=Microthyrium microscopicum TaxID=703497 RepID=A0A6A6TZC3_9PEZI|nr:tannase and feruloyl esterase [Microthyrium microscopicum]